uniref:CCHC-type domain-containing protein n=1 Tax=Macrostomum lignano TaxID=282301 RepID=A0A1I8JGD9_9PLAT
GGGGAALSDSILASAPGSAIAGRRRGSGVLLTAVEQTYAGALESHTQAALDRGDPGPDLCAAMRHAVAGKLGDPALVDFWALIDRVGSARRGAHGSLREARAAPAFQRTAARLALEHLEASYAAFVRQAVAKEPARARLGGVPGNRALIRAFAGLPRPPAGLLEDGQVDGRPVWAVIYFHMRCGFLNDALTVAKDAAAVLGDFPAALEEYVANDRQLAAETEARLASQLRRAVDPYRRLLICLMARCDVADCHADVATSVEDFLWLRLSQIAWDGRSDRLSLGALQRQLAEEYGEAHFSAWQQPLLFFSVLFLTQQWELALAFLSRSEPLRCHAVHAALAMHDRRLLLLAESPDAPLTSRLDGGLVALNLCRLVQLYSRRLETSRPLDALNLLHCLRPGAAFRAAAAELVSASRQFDLLLGRVDPDTGVRRRGAVQRFGLDASELAAGVAEASESAGRLEEAACLFELAGRWDRTLGPLCRLLSACIAQPPAAPDRRRTLEFAAAAAARLRRAGPSEEARAPLAGTLYRLLDLSTYFTMFYEGRHSAALQLLDHLRLLPARLDAVDARVRAFEASGSDELRRCLPDLLLTCMRLLQLLHRAAVEAAARPGSGGGLSSAEPAPPAAAEMRERAQALVAFAGKLPFRLPSSVYARLTQLEVQIQEGDTAQHPLGRLLLGLEVESPHESRSACLGLVHWALVHAAHILPVHRDRLDEDDRYHWCQLLQSGLLDHASLRVPARAFHEEAVDVGTLPRRSGHVLASLLGDIALQAHSVQRPLVFARHLLHDGREERLRVEQAAEPHGCGQLEVGRPALKLLHALQQICVPNRQTKQRRIGSALPALRHLVEEHRVAQRLHATTTYGVRSSGGTLPWISTKLNSSGNFSMISSRICLIFSSRETPPPLPAPVSRGCISNTVLNSFSLVVPLKSEFGGMRKPGAKWSSPSSISGARYSSRDDQVTCVEWIHAVPALRSKLASLRHDSVEVAECKQNSLKLVFTRAHLQSVLVEVVKRLVEVSKHTGRRLVCDLDSILENTLRNDVRLGTGRRLRRNKDAVVFVRRLGILFQFLLQSSQPLGYQMDVLQNDPMSFLSCQVHSSFSDHLLTLTQADVVEILVIRVEADCATELLDVLQRLLVWLSAVNALVENNAEGLQRELVHRVDLIQIVQDEVQQRCSACSSSVPFASLINLDLCNLGLCNLFFNFDGRSLVGLKIFHQGVVTQEIAFRSGETRQLELFQIRPFLAHDGRQQLVLQAIACHSELNGASLLDGVSPKQRVQNWIDILFDLLQQHCVTSGDSRLDLVHVALVAHWGSIISGQRSALVRIVAFSIDMRSLGRPSLFHVAICASSTSMEIGSMFSVVGTEFGRPLRNGSHICSIRSIRYCFVKHPTKRRETDTKASLGHSWNQSIDVQLTTAGNLRARTRSVVPTGLKHRITFRVLRTFSMKNFQQFSREVSDLTRCQEIVDEHKELLIGHLCIRHQEYHADVLQTRLDVQLSERERRVCNTAGHLLNWRWEALHLQMLRQDTVVDRAHRVLSGEGQRKDGEMTLQTRIDVCSVVPMAVVHVLPNQSVRLHREVLVYLGHIQIVDEVDQLLGARRTKVSSSLLLQRLLQNALQHLRGGVKVERHVRDHSWGQLSWVTRHSSSEHSIWMFACSACTSRVASQDWTYGFQPRSAGFRYRIPARDTVAGVAVFRWLISNSRRIEGVKGMRSLEASVRILLSSMTVFSDSIHMGSMSPSRTIHLGPSWVMLARSRMITEKRPSFHSRVDGLMMPNSSSLVTALGFKSTAIGFFFWFCVAQHEHRVSYSEKLLKLHDLQDEVVLWLELEIQCSSAHLLLEVQVALPRHVQGGEQVTDETHEDGKIVGYNLWDVEVAQGSHQHLIFRPLRIASLQGAGHHQHRLDGPQTPIVVILLRQQLSAQRVNLLAEEVEAGLLVLDGILDALHLNGHHGQHLYGDAVELVKAAPGTRLRQALVNVSDRLVVHLFGAVEHVNHDAQGSAKIFRRLRLSSTYFIEKRSAAHDEMQRLGQCNVAAISERSDHKSRRVTQVLVSVAELRVADVGKAVALDSSLFVLFIPTMAQLGQPGEGLRILYLLGNQFSYDISIVHVDGTDGHDFLSVLSRQLANQHLDQGVQLCDLLLVIVFQRVLVTLLKAGEGNVDLARPANLTASQGHLRRIVENPLVTRLFFVLTASASDFRTVSRISSSTRFSHTSTWPLRSIIFDSLTFSPSLAYMSVATLVSAPPSFFNSRRAVLSNSFVKCFITAGGEFPFDRMSSKSAEDTKTDEDRLKMGPGPLNLEPNLDYLIGRAQLLLPGVYFSGKSDTGTSNKLADSLSFAMRFSMSPISLFLASSSSYELGHEYWNGPILRNCSRSLNFFNFFVYGLVVVDLLLELLQRWLALRDSILSVRINLLRCKDVAILEELVLELFTILHPQVSIGVEAALVLHGFLHDSLHPFHDLGAYSLQLIVVFHFLLVVLVPAVRSQTRNVGRLPVDVGGNAVHQLEEAIRLIFVKCRIEHNIGPLQLHEGHEQWRVALPVDCLLAQELQRAHNDVNLLSLLGDLILALLETVFPIVQVEQGLLTAISFVSSSRTINGWLRFSEQLWSTPLTHSWKARFWNLQQSISKYQELLVLSLDKLSILAFDCSGILGSRAVVERLAHDGGQAPVNVFNLLVEVIVVVHELLVQRVQDVVALVAKNLVVVVELLEDVHSEFAEASALHAAVFNLLELEELDRRVHDVGYHGYALYKSVIARKDQGVGKVPLHWLAFLEVFFHFSPVLFECALEGVQDCQGFLHSDHSLFDFAFEDFVRVKEVAALEFESLMNLLQQDNDPGGHTVVLAVRPDEAQNMEHGADLLLAFVELSLFQVGKEVVQRLQMQADVLSFVQGRNHAAKHVFERRRVRAVDGLQDVAHLLHFAACQLRMKNTKMPSPSSPSRCFIAGPLIERQLRRLAQHKYNACGSSLLEIVMQPLWRRLLCLVPMRAAPNALTLTGLAFNASSAGLMLWLCPDARQNPPAWLCLYAAVALFSYQTLDALDGKQARRTGTASPLGELFDHGCDAANTLLLCLCVCIAAGFGEEPHLLLFMIGAAQTVFYAAHWLGYNSGRLQFGFVDVTEAQAAAMAVFLATAFAGVGVWDLQPAAGLPWLRVRHCLPISTVLASAPLVCRLTVSVATPGGLSVAGSGRLGPGLAWLALSLLSAAAAGAAVSTGALHRHPCLLAFALGAPAVKTCQRLIIAQMTRSSIRTLDLCLVWPALLAVGIGVGHRWLGLTEGQVGWGVSVAAAADCAVYSGRVCRQIAAYLGVQPFLPAAGAPLIEWNRWKAMFSNYLLASGAIDLPEQRKQALLIHCLGAEGQNIYMSLQASSNQEEGEQPPSTPELTLATAVQLAERLETGLLEAQAIKGGSHTDPNSSCGVQQISKAKNSGAAARQHEALKSTTDGRSCGYCGSAAHVGGQTCPAKGQKCKSCGKRGHFARVCRSGNRVRQLQDEYSICTVSTAAAASKHCEVLLNGRPVKLLVDSGSRVSIITKTTYNRLLSNVPLQASSRKLVAFNGSKIGVLGDILTSVQLKDKVVPYVNLSVVNTGSDILGCDLMDQLGLWIALTTLLSSSGSGHRPLRLHRWADRLLNYSFTVKYVPGAKNIVPDFLSRCQDTAEPTEGDETDGLEVQRVLLAEALTVVTEDELAEATSKDELLARVAEFTVSAELMLGRKITTPLWTLQPKRATREHPLADQIQERQRRQFKRLNRSRQPPRQFRVGDLVRVRSPRMRGKLQSHVSPPLRVSDIISPTIVRLEDGSRWHTSLCMPHAEPEGASTTSATAMPPQPPVAAEPAAPEGPTDPPPATAEADAELRRSTRLRAPPLWYGQVSQAEIPIQPQINVTALGIEPGSLAHQSLRYRWATAPLQYTVTTVTIAAVNYGKVPSVFNICLLPFVPDRLGSASGCPGGRRQVRGHQQPRVRLRRRQGRLLVLRYSRRSQLGGIFSDSLLVLRLTLLPPPLPPSALPAASEAANHAASEAAARGEVGQESRVTRAASDQGSQLVTFSSCPTEAGKVVQMWMTVSTARRRVAVSRFRLDSAALRSSFGLAVPLPTTPVLDVAAVAAAAAVAFGKPAAEIAVVGAAGGQQSVGFVRRLAELRLVQRLRNLRRQRRPGGGGLQDAHAADGEAVEGDRQVLGRDAGNQEAEGSREAAPGDEAAGRMREGHQKVALDAEGAEGVHSQVADGGHGGLVQPADGRVQVPDVQADGLDEPVPGDGQQQHGAVGQGQEDHQEAGGAAALTELPATPPIMSRPPSTQRSHSARRTTALADACSTEHTAIGCAAGPEALESSIMIPANCFLERPEVNRILDKISASAPEELHKGERVAVLLRDAGGNNIGRRANDGAVAAKAGAEGQRPDQRQDGQHVSQLQDDGDHRRGERDVVDEGGGQRAHPQDDEDGDRQLGGLGQGQNHKLHLVSNPRRCRPSRRSSLPILLTIDNLRYLSICDICQSAISADLRYLPICDICQYGNLRYLPICDICQSAISANMAIYDICRSAISTILSICDICQSAISANLRYLPICDICQSAIYKAKRNAHKRSSSEPNLLLQLGEGLLKWFVSRGGHPVHGQAVLQLADLGLQQRLHRRLLAGGHGETVGCPTPDFNFAPDLGGHGVLVGLEVLAPVNQAEEGVGGHGDEHDAQSHVHREVGERDALLRQLGIRGDDHVWRIADRGSSLSTSHSLMVTGAISRMVVTLSKKAEITAANRHSSVTSAIVRPLASRNASTATQSKKPDSEKMPTMTIMPNSRLRVSKSSQAMTSMRLGRLFTKASTATLMSEPSMAARDRCTSSNMISAYTNARTRAADCDMFSALNTSSTVTVMLVDVSVGDEHNGEDDANLGVVQARPRRPPVQFETAALPTASCTRRGTSSASSAGAGLYSGDCLQADAEASDAKRSGPVVAGLNRLEVAFGQPSEAGDTVGALVHAQKVADPMTGGVAPRYWPPESSSSIESGPLVLGSSRLISFWPRHVLGSRSRCASTKLATDSSVTGWRAATSRSRSLSAATRAADEFDRLGIINRGAIRDDVLHGRTVQRVCRRAQKSRHGCERRVHSGDPEAIRGAATKLRRVGECCQLRQVAHSGSLKVAPNGRVGKDATVQKHNRAGGVPQQQYDASEVGLAGHHGSAQVQQVGDLVQGRDGQSGGSSRCHGQPGGGHLLPPGDAAGVPTGQRVDGAPLTLRPARRPQNVGRLARQQGEQLQALGVGVGTGMRLESKARVTIGPEYSEIQSWTVWSVLSCQFEQSSSESACTAYRLSVNRRAQLCEIRASPAEASDSSPSVPRPGVRAPETRVQTTHRWSRRSRLASAETDQLVRSFSAGWSPGRSPGTSGFRDAPSSVAETPVALASANMESRALVLRLLSAAGQEDGVDSEAPDVALSGEGNATGEDERKAAFSAPPGGAGDREAHQHRAPAFTNRALRLATFNCRTLKSAWRRGMLALLASDLRLDLVMLQELSITAESGLHREDLGAGWTLHYTSADSRGRGGVGALVGPRLGESVCCVSLSARLLRVDVRLRRCNARLFYAYAPTAAHQQEAQEFFELLSEQLELVAHRDTVVVLGDLNAVAPRSERCPFVSPRQNANTAALADLMARLNRGAASFSCWRSLARWAVRCFLDWADARTSGICDRESTTAATSRSATCKASACLVPDEVARLAVSQNAVQIAQNPWRGLLVPVVVAAPALLLRPQRQELLVGGHEVALHQGNQLVAFALLGLAGRMPARTARNRAMAADWTSLRPSGVTRQGKMPDGTAADLRCLDVTGQARVGQGPTEAFGPEADGKKCTQSLTAQFVNLILFDRFGWPARQRRRSSCVTRGSDGIRGIGSGEGSWEVEKPRAEGESRGRVEALKEGRRNEVAGLGDQHSPAGGGISGGPSESASRQKPAMRSRSGAGISSGRGNGVQTDSASVSELSFSLLETTGFELATALLLESAATAAAVAQLGGGGGGTTSRNASNMALAISCERIDAPELMPLAHLSRSPRAGPAAQQAGQRPLQSRQPVPPAQDRQQAKVASGSAEPAQPIGQVGLANIIADFIAFAAVQLNPQQAADWTGQAGQPGQAELARLVCAGQLAHDQFELARLGPAAHLGFDEAGFHGRSAAHQQPRDWFSGSCGVSLSFTSITDQTRKPGMPVGLVAN